MMPALYVDVDCDLHTSSIDALDFLFANGLVGVGTLVGYDDWWTIPCVRYHSSRPRRPPSPLAVGEGLAHAQIAQKYGVRFVCVAGPCQPSIVRGDLHDNWAPIFVVAEIGAPQVEVDHGFHFGGPQEEARWMSSYPVCFDVG